ncbi:MAG TPA: exodeoxyribonuclease V subunit alpha [Spirochaetes bacterium]|nr:exodeoxyribonuclease V subunit alpha [Spirochaetota bacterium]
MNRLELDALRPHFDDLDWQFARFIEGLNGGSGGLFLAALLVSHRTGLGDVCLDLEAAGGGNINELVELDGPGFALPETAGWVEELRQSPLVCGADGKAPLVLDGKGRLYLYRYFLYERSLARDILSRYARLCDDVDTELLNDGVKRLFGPGEGELDYQALAAIGAVVRPFSVISGGPGTGKTTTVVKVMALAAEQFLKKGRQPLIAMAAPTGKASRRLRQAVEQALETLPCDDAVKARLPREATTIHRLLGSRWDSPYFRHGRENPLPHDMVLMDETSMADLPLLSKFFEALRPDARVILLGDRDQLASVETGAAFGDICAGGGEIRESIPYTPVKKAPSPAGSIVILKKSYRFGPESGIGRLAAAVREGDFTAVKDVLENDSFVDVRWRRLPPPGGLAGALEEMVLDGYGAYLLAPDPGAALAAMGNFMILSPLRRGPWGAHNLNMSVEFILKRHYFIESGEKWYRHRPVMVNVNDYGSGLFNGDTGVVFPGEESDGPRAYFEDEGGSLRALPPSRLPSHETCFALTVHKSQGSEYDRVLLILPGRYSPVLTRELLYTAVTRARKFVAIWADEAVMKKTVEAVTRRASGLRDLLWPGPASDGSDVP